VAADLFNITTDSLPAAYDRLFRTYPDPAATPTSCADSLRAAVATNGLLL
jgi:hypothetical protein